MVKNHEKTLQQTNEGVHVFEHLVALKDWAEGQDYRDDMVQHLNGVIQHMWDDELKHYHGCISERDDVLGDLSDDEVEDYARGYTTMAVCDTHGDDVLRMVVSNANYVFTCRECEES